MNLAQMLATGPKLVAQNRNKTPAVDSSAYQQRRLDAMIDRYGKAFAHFGGKASRSQVVTHLGVHGNAWAQFQKLEELGYIRRTGEHVAVDRGNAGFIWEWVDESC